MDGGLLKLLVAGMWKSTGSVGKQMDKLSNMGLAYSYLRQVAK